MAAPTNINGNRGDYICIKTRVRDCFLRYGVAARQQLACGNLAKRYLSDHLPLWIVLEAQ